MNGNPVGAVLTLRDRAEFQAVIRELDTVRALADALRAHAHESANQLQALVDLVELGRYEDAVRLGTRDSSMRNGSVISYSAVTRVGGTISTANDGVPSSPSTYPSRPLQPTLQPR